MWRRRGGEVGDAYFALALLFVSSARRGTLRADSAGVLGGSRIARAAGSSPATSKACLFVCCCGAAVAAILGVAAQPEEGGRCGSLLPSPRAPTATWATLNVGSFCVLCWVQ